MREEDYHRAMFFATPSSSEEERDYKIRRHHEGARNMKFQTPFKKQQQDGTAMTTPLTVTQMTPSPIRSPLASSNPGVAPTRAPGPTFADVQQGYLDDQQVSTALFRDVTPAKSRRKSRSSSSRRSRLSQSLLLDDYDATPRAPLGMMERRRSSTQRERRSSNPKTPILATAVPMSSPDASSESSPDASPSRRVIYPRSLPNAGLDSLASQKQKSRAWLLTSAFFGLVVLSSIGMLVLMQSAASSERVYELTRPDYYLQHPSEAGLRGKMTQGHWEDKKNKAKPEKPTKKEQHPSSHHHASKVAVHKKESHQDSRHENQKTKPKKITKNMEHSDKVKTTVSPKLPALPQMHMPPPISSKPKQNFDGQDPNLYSRHSSKHARVVALDPSVGSSLPHPRKTKSYPADFTDNTQFYSILDSSDERLSHMELHEPYSNDECVPMQDWQTIFHPLCNGVHELGIENMGEDNPNDVNLFGTKGYWRNAWRLDLQNDKDRDIIVLKTLKFEHNFEDAHFEHDRIDAVAMERLTSSPHVINAFGFCGHSVMTEYADGSRMGELADKAKKTPLARLVIARDVANGLADVHGIDGDGDGNSTFVHLDVNPANVVSIGGTLKLNDFNIGIIRRWNTTSNKPCGFPAQYPNPQWRSPEEARNEQDLTEKVDIFSLGHIFFRLICGHEPWNKLELGGRPSKEQMNEKVQKGVLPFIPEHVLKSENSEVIAIRDAMLQCYTFDPLKRPSARKIATGLDQALEALGKTIIE